MIKLITASAAAAALVLSASLVDSAWAQDKGKMEKSAAGQVTRKNIAENDKVLVYEVTYKPGAENKAIATSSTRVVRALAGGTLERTYADGKKEKVTYKTGQVRINQPGPAFTSKNIGKGEIRFYVVQVK